MKSIQHKHKTVIIFAVLVGTTLLFFQNCSSSVFMLGAAKQSNAKTDFSEIINDSEKEISSTKDLVLGKDHVDLDLKNADEADPSIAGLGDVEMRSDKDVRIKLVRKPAKAKQK